MSDEVEAKDAPIWYSAERADAWADGYNAAIERLTKDRETFRDTLAEQCEKSLALQTHIVRTEMALERIRAITEVMLTTSAMADRQRILDIIHSINKEDDKL